MLPLPGCCCCSRTNPHVCIWAPMSVVRREMRGYKLYGAYYVSRLWARARLQQDSERVCERESRDVSCVVCDIRARSSRSRNCTSQSNLCACFPSLWLFVFILPSVFFFLLLSFLLHQLHLVSFEFYFACCESRTLGALITPRKSHLDGCFICEVCAKPKWPKQKIYARTHTRSQRLIPLRCAKIARWVENVLGVCVCVRPHHSLGAAANSVLSLSDHRSFTALCRLCSLLPTAQPVYSQKLFWND